MLDMGFFPDIERIVRFPDMPAATGRQTLMFSATFPDEVQGLAKEFLNDYLFLVVGVVGGACSDVHQTFFEVRVFAKWKIYVWVSLIFLCIVCRQSRPSLR